MFRFVVKMFETNFCHLCWNYRQNIRLLNQNCVHFWLFAWQNVKWKTDENKILPQCGQCIWFTGKLCELLTKSYFLRELFLAIKWKRNKKNVLGISYNMMWSKRINADYAYLGNSPVFSWLTMKNLRKLHHLNF